MSQTSITIANRISVKIDNYLLDAFSFQKHKSTYLENKTAINTTIKALSEKHKTTKVRDIKMLIISEILSKEDKKKLLFLYEKEITKFN